MGAVGDAYFNYLEYSTMCLSGAQASRNRFLKSQIKEKRMAFSNLLRIKKD